MQNHLFVFDIETVPDVSAVKALLGQNWQEKYEGESYKGWTLVQKQRQALTDYHLNITDGKNGFPRQPFHQVVAISYALVDINPSSNAEAYSLKILQSGGTVESGEEELIAGFFRAIDKYKPRLVSFNGRSFDLPVLKYRAMKYGIVAKGLFSGVRSSNYSYRYSTEWHCDLLDALSDYGASARIKLDEVCSILNIPGKFGVSGDKVSELYDADKLSDIRDYCETDVLNTYLLYLKYMKFSAKTSSEDYDSAIHEVWNFLDSHENTKLHLKSFKQAWLQSEADQNEAL